MSQQSDFADDQPWRQLGYPDLAIPADMPDLDSTGRDDHKRQRRVTLFCRIRTSPVTACSGLRLAANAARSSAGADVPELWIGSGG